MVIGAKVPCLRRSFKEKGPCSHGSGRGSASRGAARLPEHRPRPRGSPLPMLLLSFACPPICQQARHPGKAWHFVAVVSRELWFKEEGGGEREQRLQAEAAMAPFISAPLLALTCLLAIPSLANGASAVSIVQMVEEASPSLSTAIEQNLRHKPRMRRHQSHALRHTPD